MKNTLITLLKEKGYTVVTNTNNITFYNDIYSINLYNNNMFTFSIHLLQPNTTSITPIISFNSPDINIKSIRAFLDAMINLQIHYSYNDFSSLTLNNDYILKKCYNDLSNILDDYLIHLAINNF